MSDKHSPLARRMMRKQFLENTLEKAVKERAEKGFGHPDYERIASSIPVIRKNAIEAIERFDRYVKALRKAESAELQARSYRYEKK